ncbi:MAG: response regulator [Desulfobacterales bacterium]
MRPESFAGEARAFLLLVDDDREMLRELGGLLAERLGGDAAGVLFAEEGGAALEILGREPVGVLVTDLKMAGMDGWELLQRAASGFPDVPGVVITGYATPETAERLREQGVSAVLAKPFLVSELAGLIREILARETEGGVIRGISPSLFLQVVEMEEKTCTIRLSGAGDRRRGVLFFQGGKLFDARLGAMRGERAAREILSWDQALLTIENACPVRERAIGRDLHGLMIDAACHRDERADLERNGRGEQDGRDELETVRRMLEEALGGEGAIGPLRRDPQWAERARRLARAGERLGLGGLIAAFLDRGGEFDFLLRGGGDPWVAEVRKGTPRDILLRVPGS